MSCVISQPHFRALKSFLLISIAVLQPRSFANVCVYTPPTVQCVCGTVVDTNKQAVPSVKLTVIRDNEVIKEVSSSDNGSFDFGSLPAGKYELRVNSVGFAKASYLITVRNPSVGCKRALQVEVAIGGQDCTGDIRLLKKRPSGQ
jgi:hypothetical protein